MAPQTNIGSASAVTSTGGDIGGTLGQKIENDAAAFIRALAAVPRPRRRPCPGEMVTEAANVTATEALDAERDRPRSPPTRTTCSPSSTASRSRARRRPTLHTAGLQIDERDMPLQYQLLQLLVNPTIAYLLLLLGLVGIAIEIFSPGLIIPGLLGAVSLAARRLRHRPAAGDRDRDRAPGRSGSR